MPVCAFGHPCREALWELVDAAQADDPLAPVTVLPPSSYTGLALRRSLAARPDRRGLANVRFLPMARLAELLGAPNLASAGRRPLTAPLRAAAVRGVLAADPGVLAGTAEHPAAERTLEATLLDLRRAGDGAAGALADRGAAGAALVRQLERFRALTRDFYDDEDLARAAAASVREGRPALHEVGVVVLFLPERLTPGQLDLVDALRDVGDVHVVLGVTGDPDADEATHELGRRLGVAGGPAVGAVPSPTGLLSAPDPEDEVRAVRRQVVERAEAGVPLHRLAVLYRVEEQYAPLTQQLFDAADIAWSGPPTRRLSDTTSGRVLLGLLRLPDDDFRRDEVAAWLSSGPVRDPADGRDIPSHRWDVLSRRAGVIAGLDQWAGRLVLHAQLLDAESQRDESDASRDRRRHERDDCERLAAFVAGLGDRLALDSSSWAEIVDRVRGLLDDYLGSPLTHGSWPESEADAHERVVAALEGLRALDELGPPPDTIGADAMRRALEIELAAPAGRVGRSGQGVFVGPLRHALGADFDTVWVLGAAEGELPPRGREDPLLPDHEREAVDPVLRLHAGRRAEERRQYLAALAAGDRRILTFPRADPRAQRKRLPARWFVEAAEQLSGRDLSAEDLLGEAIGPWFEAVPSFEAGVVTASPAGSLEERDVADLAHWYRSGRPVGRHALVEATPCLARGFDAVRSRLSAGFSRFDGAVPGRSDLLPARPVSPTALESWATCPFSYFLAHVLHIGVVDRPEEIESISPLERGTLVHDILEEFVRIAPARVRPDEPWSPEDRALLRAIADRRGDEVEAAGLTGRPLLWQLTRRELGRELAAFLERDEQLRAELGVVPWEVELEFGFADSAVPPVPVQLDGRTIELRGRIDRIDRSPDGARVAVSDYKTGSSMRSDHLEAHLERGTMLQLAVYGLAARRLAPAATVESAYWYLRDGTRGGYPLDDPHEATFREVVGDILEGVAGGAFPAYPGEPRVDRHSWENCLYCPYDSVCPSGRTQTWERMRDDPQIVTFRRRAEPDDDNVDEAAEATP